MCKKLEHWDIHHFQNGDQKAFEKVFNFFYSSIVVFCNRIVRDQDEAEDITIEAFISLHKRYWLFNEVADIRAFLYVTARNRCLNYLKSKKIHDRCHLIIARLMKDDGWLEYEYAIKAEIVMTIHKAIEGLPMKCRKVFKLLYYEELKPAEVAAMLQISVNTVYVQTNRARNILRDKLK